MVQKVPGFPNAIGYWGRDPHCAIALDQTAAKERALLQDQLRANGQPITAWLPVRGGVLPGLAATPGIVRCTCFKDTASVADSKCLSCYGTGFVPGYLRFLFETLHYSSAEAASFVLTGMEVDLTKRPNRLRLQKGVLTGTVVTTDKAYANPKNDAWEFELVTYRKTAGDTFTLEVSFDSGGSWSLLTMVAAPSSTTRGCFRGAFTANGSGTLRFRVTLLRSAGDTPESPSFEVLRARHLRSGDANPLVVGSGASPGAKPGQLLILKTWDQEFVSREIARGRSVEAMGDRSWTAPLDFFDLTITRDTPPAAFDDREAGPHPYFEYVTGIRLAQRYAMYGINLDVTVDNMFSHQSFSERRVQQAVEGGEAYTLIF